MTYALSEPFDDARGRWNAFAPWDATEAFESVKGFLATQQHVDLRSFRTVVDLFPTPQDPDLDLPSQTFLESETQTQMEASGTNLQDEHWTLTGTGLNAITVGKIASRGGWSGLHTTTTGAAISANLISSMTTPIDLSAMDKISLIFPDYNTFDGTSKVTLTSSPDGTFTDVNYLSGAGSVFSANTSVMPHLLLTIATFTTAAGVSFDISKVTGVRINLVKAVAPANALALSVMAIRGVTTAWTQSWLDFDTRLGAICVPVSLTGAPYGGTVAQHFEFVRGDGGHEDPIPADMAINIFFYPGGETSPNDATGGSHNRLSILLRETKSIADGVGSHIEASLLWDDTSTSFEAKRRDTTGGTPPGATTDFGDYTSSIGGALDATKQYVYSIEIRGTQISAKLYEANLAQEIGNFVWHLSTTLTDTNYVYRNGRVGFIADLLTRDAFVSAITVAPTGFAELISEEYVQRTPIDGAQLAAVAASDINLWDSFTGPDIFIDQTKTLSGTGSYRSAKSLTTNTFVMDDWTQSYLNLAIWVPASVTRSNQPEIFLNTGSGTEHLALPKLQPAQWNALHFDLGIFRNLLTGIGYSFSVQSAASPDRPLGYFWVDSVVLGRRRVAWYMRARSNAAFRPFKDLVNKPKGAVHLNPEERGVVVQLKAVALTEDAWISSFKLFPRHAQLGNAITDKAFDTV